MSFQSPFKKLKYYENNIKITIKYIGHKYVLVNKTFDNFMYQVLFTECMVFSKEKVRCVFKTKMVEKY